MQLGSCHIPDDVVPIAYMDLTGKPEWIVTNWRSFDTDVLKELP